jgi:hypothetical protein
VQRSETRGNITQHKLMSENATAQDANQINPEESTAASKTGILTASNSTTPRCTNNPTTLSTHSSNESSLVLTTSSGSLALHKATKYP